MKITYVITVLVFGVALVGLGIWSWNDSRGQDADIRGIATADDTRIQSLTADVENIKGIATADDTRVQSLAADVENISRRLAALEALAGQIPDNAVVAVTDPVTQIPIDHTEYVRWSDDTENDLQWDWDFERGRIDGVGTINPTDYSQQYWSSEDHSPIALHVAVEIDINENNPEAILDTTQWYLVTEPYDPKYPQYEMVLEEASDIYQSTATKCVEKAYVRHDYKCGLVFRIPDDWWDSEERGWIEGAENTKMQLAFLYRTSEGVESLNWYIGGLD